jgi:hypothetical protein
MANKSALLLGRLVPMAYKPVLREYRFVPEDCRSLGDCRPLKRFRKTFLVIQLVQWAQQGPDNLDYLAFPVALQAPKVHENQPVQGSLDNLELLFFLEVQLVLLDQVNQVYPVYPDNQEILLCLEDRLGLDRRYNQEFRPGRDNHPYLVYQANLQHDKKDN